MAEPSASDTVGGSSAPSRPLAVPQPLLSAALARAEHPALIAGDTVWTSARLQTAVARRAAWLATQGLAVGEVVPLLGAPSIDWVVSFHALGWLGAVAAPLPEGQPQAEQERLLRELRPRVVLADEGAAAALGSTQRWLPLATAAAELAAGDGTSADEGAPERFWPLDEPRVVIFTSGSTGPPRRVELTTAQLLFNTFGSVVRLGHDLHDRWLACLPLHHIGGLSILTRCAWLGSCVVLEPRFEAERVARLLDGGTVTLASLVPAMLARVLDARAALPFPNTLRALLIGGAPLPRPLLDRCRALGVPLALSWGMSETASQVATRFAGDLAAEHGAPPLAFTRVGAQDGRLTVRGPTVRGAQLLTDDTGYLDALGHVHVTGRADDVMLSGGEKIVPGELEALLETHPAVAEVAVVARPDERWGQRPVAFLVPRAAPVPVAELTGWCRERLAAFKLPAEFLWCDALPRTELGKVARATLRERACAERTASAAGLAPPSTEAPAAPNALLRRLAASCEAPAVAQLDAQLDALRDWLGRDLSEIEQQLQWLSAADRNVAQRAAAHLLAQPGKRIRPLCVLLAGRLGAQAPGGGLRRRLNELALSCELVHAATLLHDDVIDLGTERRGAPASRLLFGNTASILAGDHLLNEALRKVSAHGGHELLAELLDVIEQMIGAEAVQLEQQHRFDPRPELYLQIVEGKTAALFRWGLRAGATLAGLPPEVVAAAGEFGCKLGVAFQLVDDLLDLAGDPQQVGKDVLADLREGKLTWPLLVAAQRDPGLAAELRRAATDPPADQAAHGARLLRRVEATGALAATRGSALDYAQRATQALQQLPESEARRALAAVVEFCLARPS